MVDRGSRERSDSFVTTGGEVSTSDELQGISFIKFADGTYNTQTGTFVANAPPLAAPHISSFSLDTNVAGDGITNANHISTVEVLDGTIQIGTATTNALSVTVDTVALGMTASLASDTGPSSSDKITRIRLSQDPEIRTL